MKTCPKCGIQKEITDFHNNKNFIDGHYPWCKDCSNANRRKVEENYKKTEKWKQSHDKAKERLRGLYPHKFKARKMAQSRAGKLRKESCEQCGDKNNLHMHHPDYNEPLEVVTLCRPCHDKLHATLKSRSSV